MGVGPLAIFLAGAGFVVSGEDDALSDEMRAQLMRAGVTIGPIGPQCDLVAYSSAIAPTHPAYTAAVTRGVPLVRRGELLAEVTRTRKLVAICGSHGKSTTTAMLITALHRAGFPAGYVLGGLFSDDTAPADAGTNEWVVAEIDESDGTIERFSPEITVAVNLDWDHPDHYRTKADIEAAFAALFSRTRGMVLTSTNCAMSAGVVGTLGGSKALTFGPSGDFRGELSTEDAERMTLRLGGRFVLTEASVRARGEFNAANATAALAAAQLMGARCGSGALVDYAAVRRRQSPLPANGFTAIEDYAHHPAEIRALLTSLRRQLGVGGRLLAVFQPHRYSRTAQFGPEFAEALSSADQIYLLDVYGAGEAPVPGGTTADLAMLLASRSTKTPLTYRAEGERETFAQLRRDLRPNDTVAFIGAGDIDRKARRWLAQVEVSSTPGADWDGFVATVRPQLTAASKLVREESLASKTTMRVGGAARVYAEPASLPDLQALLRTATAAGLPVYVLGRGSNLIVPDEGVDGLVIALAHEAWAGFDVQPEGRVWVGAGLRLKNLCGLAAKAGLAGFEFLEGIPASVGGALRMNAGAMGGWIFDVVEEVQLVTLAGETKTLPKPAMHVDYRHCGELQDAIAVAALLCPSAQADGTAVKRQMDAYAKKRHESQPREPSAGCIFKNPPGNSAGRLIDESGLKGTRVGGAEVSTVHANFIVNRGGATSADILELVRRIRARVKETKGVDLQPEVLLYGRKWEDVL